VSFKFKEFNVGDEVAIQRHSIVTDEYYGYLYFKGTVVKKTPRRFFVEIECKNGIAKDKAVYKCDPEGHILYSGVDRYTQTHSDKVNILDDWQKCLIEKSEILVENLCKLTKIKEGFENIDIHELYFSKEAHDGFKEPLITMVNLVEKLSELSKFAEKDCHNHF
jgi:hypothetical protein